MAEERSVSVLDLFLSMQTRFRALLDGMEERPQMYAQSLESFEDQYLLVLMFASDALGTPEDGEDLNTVIANAHEFHGCGNGTLARKMRESQASPDEAEWWAKLALWLRAIRNTVFPDWNNEDNDG